MTLSLFPSEVIETKILRIREKTIILDCDLAKLYGVETKRLNQQVNRNRGKFPEDFMFELSQDEKDEVVANCDHLKKLRFSSVLPKAFTEHGVLQVANILNNQRANKVSIQVIRVFNSLRELANTNNELKMKIKELEAKMLSKFANSDKSFKLIFEALNHVLYPKETTKTIGFRVKREE